MKVPREAARSRDDALRIARSAMRRHDIELEFVQCKGMVSTSVVGSNSAAWLEIRPGSVTNWDDVKRSALERPTFVETTWAPTLFDARLAPVFSATEAHVLPTLQYLLTQVLRGFAVREIAWPSYEHFQGEGAVLPGVIEVRRLRPSILLIGGASGAGKSVLARQFQQAGIHVLSFDFYLSELVQQGRFRKIESLVDLFSTFDPNNIGTWLDGLVGTEREARLAEVLASFVDPGAPLVVAESYGFSIPTLAARIEDLLKGKGFGVYWVR